MTDFSFPKGKVRTRESNAADVSNLLFTKSDTDTATCEYCQVMLTSRFDYQKHMNEFHRDQRPLPFVCDTCQKGFFSLTGLRHHMNTHKGYQHACSVCDSKFLHKHHLMRHLKNVHKLRMCRSCFQVVHVEEFDAHVLNCSNSYPI